MLLNLAGFCFIVNRMSSANLQRDLPSVQYPKYPRKGWIGVDLDGTLATSGPTSDYLGIGEPVPHMLLRVHHWLRTGRTVKIFSARAKDSSDVRNIHKWCERHGLPPLEVTCEKDYGMIAIWDDRAVGVVRDLGIPLLPEKLGFWKRVGLALRIVFGSASGVKAAGAIVNGRTTAIVRDHLRDVLDLAPPPSVMAKRQANVFAEATF